MAWTERKSRRQTICQPELGFRQSKLLPIVEDVLRKPPDLRMQCDERLPLYACDVMHVYPDRLISGVLTATDCFLLSDFLRATSVGQRQA